MRLAITILAILALTQLCFGSARENGELVTGETTCGGGFGSFEERWVIGVEGGLAIVSDAWPCGTAPFNGHGTLTDDLWAYYTMEAADGDDATENHDATPSGTPPNVTAGKNGNGLDFTTNAYYLDIETPGAITDYTVSGWFYMPSARGFSGTTHVLSDPVTAYLTYFDTNGKPGYHGSGYLTHTAAIGTDGWHHVVWSAETTTGAYYVVIDGDWAGRKYAAAGATTTLNPSIIAASNTAANDFDGYIDELGIWSRVLTQQEVEDLYNGGSGLFY